jgi:hypothetical protein
VRTRDDRDTERRMIDRIYRIVEVFTVLAFLLWLVADAGSVRRVR